MRNRRSRDDAPRSKQFLSYTGPLMTLGNMRENGVSRLALYCDVCHHDTIFDVSAFADDIPVPTFGPRMVCTCCGAIGADACWNERRADWAVRASNQRYALS